MSEGALARQDEGERRIETWKPIHDRVLALHLAGYSNESIAQLVGYTRQHVSYVLNDPRAQKAIRKLQDRMRDRFHDRIEDKLLSLGERAVQNVAKTIEAEMDPGSRAKKHQDSVSFELLDRIGHGKKQADKDSGTNIQLSQEASDRLVEALEKSDEARRTWEQDDDGEWVPSEEGDDG